MEIRTPDSLIPRPQDPTWCPPLDEFDLAVRLETEGVTDEVAHSSFGFAHTLDMAASYYPQLDVETASRPATPGESGWRAWLRGTAFALPMLLCALSLMTVGVSLWGGDLQPDLASAVAIATVGSLVVTGGFVQAMSRRGLFYIGARDFNMAAAVSRVWAQAGAAAILSLALGGLIANQLFAWMPAALAGVTAAFFVLLGMLWLACGGLYLVNRATWIGGVTVVGIVVVAALHRGLGWALPTSQLCGLAAATAIAIAGTLSWFRARVTALPSAELISPAHEFYQAGYYLLYGALYYLFLFVDRLNAWTAHTNASALPWQFRGDYETALDLAMAAFVLQTGWVHASLAAFHRAVELEQRALPAGQYGRFNAAMREFYLWRLAYVAAFGFASSGLVYFLISRYHLLPFANMTPVLVIALAAYPIVVAGLWNTSLLFTLGQPQPVVGAVSMGALVSLVCGYLLSRTGSYDAAAVGFLAGAFTFAALSCLPVLKAFHKLDSHYYSSAL